MSKDPHQMDAVVIEATGPPSQSMAVRSEPVPEPGPGEALVEVHAAAVNPFDLANIAGLLGTPLIIRASGQATLAMKPRAHTVREYVRKYGSRDNRGNADQQSDSSSPMCR